MNSFNVNNYELINNTNNIFDTNTNTNTNNMLNDITSSINPNEIDTIETLLTMKEDIILSMK